MIAGIAFTAFVLIRAYKRNTRIRAHHASTQPGFGVSTIRAPPPSPPPQPDVTVGATAADQGGMAETGLSGALSNAAADFNILRAGGGEQRPSTSQYDRLPLVPNLEEDRNSQQLP